MKVKPSDFLHVDFLSGSSAMGWAIASQYLPDLASLVSAEAAVAFSLAAFVRWTTHFRGK